MSHEELNKKPEQIAIIGLAGRFPGARNVDEFWQNLKDGVESIRRFTPEELKASGTEQLVLVVGPEGDLTAVEREAISVMGGVEYSLGERRLRSELAALKALSLLLD